MSFRDLRLRRHYAEQAGILNRDFYIPVLSEAISYDRQAGYFDSVSLVQAAMGLAAFIKRACRVSHETPSMRLITGATWSQEDIAAYQLGMEEFGAAVGRSLAARLEPSEEECARLGLPTGWRPESDHIAQAQLGTLAWMVSEGLLEVKIAFPLDPDGRPYQPGRLGALFHPKAGLLSDEEGNTVCFHGSVNETGAAWVRNREKIEVKRSWHSPQDAEDIRYEVEEFERLWSQKDPSLLVLPLPQAVKERLMRFEPLDRPPTRDPLGAEVSARSRIEAEWLLGAPTYPWGHRLVLDPIPLTPYPHQLRVAAKVVANRQSSFLFCDEVGLGKTIEAGLAMRALVLRGQVKRALIIAPRSLVRQWMEELREKFALTAWFYDGHSLVDVDGHAKGADAFWAEEGIFLISRQLLIRSERSQDFLDRTAGWDLLVVDEAHAARRRVMGKSGPNLFLSLLQELTKRGLVKASWFLTATPMQLHAHEVHDLLLLCGLGKASWGVWADLVCFMQFFSELQRFHREKTVRHRVIGMTRTAVAHGAPELLPSALPAGWTDLNWRALLRALKGNGPGSALMLQQLTQPQAEALTPLLSRQSPLGVFVFRHTRATLRAYEERGLVAGLARRVPQDIPVTFQSDLERELYSRIDELCSEFYRLGDLPNEERGGVGFLMAVFRKRLSSSLFAFRQSLARRRELIKSALDGLAQVPSDLVAEDEPEEWEEGMDDGHDPRREMEAEVQRLQRWQSDPSRRHRLEAERQYINRYIADMDRVSQDSKFNAFREQLASLITEGHRVIVFTQYVDTLDFLRDRLIPYYGQRLGCYSGRGGEVWDQRRNCWVDVGKAGVKSRTKGDHPKPLSVLLGTDAASEGLNLQQFSAMVNYDLPWNPMRVEQRIGRIDRIGQASPVVRILNLYMQGTIEEDAYVTLQQRIGLFEEVVGPLQPILADMPRILSKVARGEIELQEARRLLDISAKDKPRSPLAPLHEYTRDDSGNESLTDASMAEPLVNQDELAKWCLANPAPGLRIVLVPEPGSISPSSDPAKGCYSLRWENAPLELGLCAGESLLATFCPDVSDRHPPSLPGEDRDAAQRVADERRSVRLLTWGDQYLTAWLEAVRGMQITEEEYHREGLEPGQNPFAAKP